MKAATETCMAFLNAEMNGNVVPNTWYDHIKFPEKLKGGEERKSQNKTDLIAIHILAEIVYWYRPTEVRDEKTGRTVGYSRKFSSDKLQISYNQISEKFGISREQVRRAVDNLKRLGAITTELRSIIVCGRSVPNIMFVEPVPEIIQKFNKAPSVLEHSLPVSKHSHNVTENIHPVNKQDTYTKTTNETSTKTTNSLKDLSSKQDLSSFKDQKEKQDQKNIYTGLTNSVIEYLNKKTNQKYRPTTGKTKKLVGARASEGFVLEDFKSVIDKKSNEWMGTEFEKYLRPETLFGTKFEGYLNQNINGENQNGNQQTKNKDWGRWEMPADYGEDKPGLQDNF